MIKSALSRLARGSLIYGVGGILQRFMSVFLLPFFTRALSPEDYGVASLLTLLSVAVTGVLALGTGNSMGILYFRENEILKRPSIIWTNVLLMSGISVIWTFALICLAPFMSVLIFQTDKYFELIVFSLLGAVVATIAEPFMAYLRMEEKAKRYVTLTLLSSLTLLGLSVYFVLWLKIGVTGIVLAALISQVLMLMLVFLVVGRLVPFGVSWKLVIPLIRIGFPSTFGVFAFMFIDYADRQMIERMLGLSELGVYSVGYNLGMSVAVIVSAFASAWPPFFMSYIGKNKEAQEIFGRVLTYYVLGFGFLIVTVFFLARPIVQLFISPDFYKAWCVIGLVASAYALKGCYLIMLPGIYFSGKLSRQLAIEWMAAFINVGLNIYLIPRHGIIGAAVATLISYISLPILTWFVARNYLEVDYQWRRITLISISVTITSIALYQLSSVEGAGALIQQFYSSIVFVIFSVFAYRNLLTARERHLILKWITK